MTTLDWLIVAFTGLLALYGYLRGFIVGALSLAGFALGAVLGTRLGPALLPGGSASPYAPLFGLIGALLAGAILAGGLEGIGARVRSWLRIPGLGLVDGVLGAVLTGAVALGIAWIGGAVALHAPGAQGLRQEVRRSAILQRLNSALPPSGPILHALSRYDPLPALHGPSPDVPAPAAGILRDGGVRAAAGGVVRVTGTACGLGIEGSGWVAGRGLVVSNAHVVAGEDDIGVQVGGTGPRLTARALVFDPSDDVAVLSVPSLSAPALRLARDPAAGTAGAILGYPEDGPFDARPARIGATASVRTEDIYGRGSLLRPVTSLRGTVRHGNSGGPVVDGRGRVLTTVFAATTAGARPGGFGVPNSVVAGALARARVDRPVGTGPCAQ